MKILYGPDFRINEPTAVTIGKFDGVHEGHVKVFDFLKETARDLGLKSVVYTFCENPKSVLHNEKIDLLMSNDEKSKAFELLGPDYLVYEKFDEKFYNMQPEEFIKKVLIEKLKVKAIVMGENSTFGKDKAGDIFTMKELGKKYGFKVVTVELLRKNGEIISSTGIREEKKLLAIE